MPLYYRHAAGHRKGEQDSELADKLQELQQQTLTMHNRWEEQQAATQACKLSALYTEAHPWTLPYAPYSTLLHGLFTNLLCTVTRSCRTYQAYSLVVYCNLLQAALGLLLTTTIKSLNAIPGHPCKFFDGSSLADLSGF